MRSQPTAFHVDLRGLVDLLSHHLYSSPRVYLRELLQNATDALTARRDVDPGWVGSVEVTPADVAADGRLHVVDTGIGLDEDAINTVLATIGASSKRDELGFARSDFLGQFGIGLLSCFLVADEIEVTTRRVGDEQTWRWIGRSDGTYEVAPSPEPRTEPGTDVALRPRPGGGDLLDEQTVRTLAGSVAGFLPIDLTVHTAAGPVLAGGRQFPWERSDLDPIRKRSEAVELGQELLGFRPLDVVELADPAGGVRGYAYVLPMPAGTRAAHRLYSRHMLVGEQVQGLLPDWAFYLRAVVNTTELALTASRESLHDDDALAETRERLGAQIRSWLLRIVQTDPTRAQQLLEVHHLGVKAMAATDETMLDIVGELLTFETTSGPLTLGQLSANASAEGNGVLSYVDSIEDFRAIAPLARAVGLQVLNAGYAYDTDILARWLAGHPELDTRRVRPTDLAGEFAAPTDAEERDFASLLETTRATLQRSGCVPMVRRFEPETVQAVLLADRGTRRELDRATLLDTNELTAGWDVALASLAPTAPAGPRFVLNAANPSVQLLASRGDDEVVPLAVEALYANALVAGQHPLRPFDAALIARALPALIERAISNGSPR